MKKILCLPLCPIAVVVFFVAMAVAEAIVVSGFLSIFEGFSRALVYAVYGVAGVYAGRIGYMPLGLVGAPSRALRAAACVLLVGLGVAFFVTADELVGGAWANPTKVFGVLLGISAPFFAASAGSTPGETAAEPSPSASQAEPAPPSSPTHI